MANFTYLINRPEYAAFAGACITAEQMYADSAVMCAAACRRALEAAVEWVYAADNTMQKPWKDGLMARIKEPSFKDAMPYATWTGLRNIVNLGNTALHETQQLNKNEVLIALRDLFNFVQWIDYGYGPEESWEQRAFDMKLLPKGKKAYAETIKAQKEQLAQQKAAYEADLAEQAAAHAAELSALQAENEKTVADLLAQVQALSAQYTAARTEHQAERTFAAPDPATEAETRKVYIDVDLKLVGWIFNGPGQNVREEYVVENMGGVPGKSGRADYVLFGKNGLPLAVVEAKNTEKDPMNGHQQASLYADCLEQKFGRRPVLFMTNGFETWFHDELSGPPRQVSCIFGEEDLERLMVLRQERRDLMQIPISDTITGRYYQKAAIRAVCGDLQQGTRRHLLVMATGTGKTRTAISLTDVLSRGNHARNVLFLADRTALVNQAEEAFKDHLPDMTVCNLCEDKDDRNARLVFSTYPTMLNAIDSGRTKDGQVLFTPAHFDMIIIDECHRSIFKKYGVIFDYFDAILVGLTATPKTDVDHNTYEFFRMETGNPTYAYDYQTAVELDHVLVPYYTFAVQTEFMEHGITYQDLSPEEQAAYEDEFAEDDGMPEHIASQALNQFVFNQDTVDLVLQDLMERGIHIEGGEKLGKTIIFAQNKKHADFILKRFDALYPEYKGSFAKRVTCEDSRPQSTIDDFSNSAKLPQIAVSVDMLDTGIDVPAVVNLVFFKKVRSKTKFWQMIGRGTRLCKDLNCTDQIDGEYTDKRRFLIFDYCGNFEYFQQEKKEYQGTARKSLSEDLFGKQIQIAEALQEPLYAGEDYQSWRSELTESCREQTAALNPDLISVRLQKEYVDRWREAEAWQHIDPQDREDLLEHVAPLVHSPDPDEAAKRFDNFLYGMMLAMLRQAPNLKTAKIQLREIAESLEQVVSIPQVHAKLPLIQQVQTDEFLQSADLLSLEHVRKEFRGLMQFLDNGSGSAARFYYTHFTDSILDRQEGLTVDTGENFESYQAKVSHYILTHGDTMAIHKLTHNIPLSPGDYEELSRVFTVELGDAEDYQQAFGDTAFGLLVRRVAKLDHEAAMAAFSQFINDESLNRQQIDFVHRIISHIEQNGYMESADLMKPPFDAPYKFVQIFDGQMQKALVQTIAAVKNNAVEIAAS